MQPSTPTPALKSNKIQKEVTNLLTSGGKAGRMKHNDTDWVYFPSSSAETATALEFLPCEDETKEDRNSIQDEVCDEEDNLLQNEDKEHKEPKKKDIDGTYRIMNMENLEKCIQSKICCKCNVETEIDDFVQF